MYVTVSFNANQALLDIIVAAANALNEPIDIINNEYQEPKWIEEYHNSSEFLESIKEAEEIRKTNTKGMNIEEFEKECMRW